jgi:hypothetical protein
MNFDFDEHTNAEHDRIVSTSYLFAQQGTDLGTVEDQARFRIRHGSG